MMQTEVSQDTIEYVNRDLSIRNIRRSNSDIIDQAKKDIDLWDVFYSKNIENYKRDYSFAFDNQWDDPNVINDRLAKQKAVLTMNRLITHIRQLLGEERSAEVGFNVSAEDENSDESVINIVSGLLRNIYERTGKIPKQEVYRNQICGGWGVFQVKVDYESDLSMDLVCSIASLPDATMAFFDPSAVTSSKQDGRYCGFFSPINIDKFEELYPNSSLDSFSSNNSFGEGVSNKKTVTIANYFVKEYYNDTLIEFSDGTVLPRKEAKQFISDQHTKYTLQRLQAEESGLDDSNIEKPVHQVNKRQTRRYRIMHYKITNSEILEKATWAGNKLPLIYVAGDYNICEGKETTYSYINPAKDAQRLFNYTSSELADMIVKTNKAQIIATLENLPTKELRDMWLNPDRHDILFAARDAQGQLPNRFNQIELPQSWFNLAAAADDSIIQSLGRYQANLGAPGNEQSGIAIANRIMQGNAGSYIYFDNLKDGLKAVADTILDIIPNIYDGTRTIKIMDVNGNLRSIKINEPLPGNYVRNKILNYRYSADVSIGDNYKISRNQTLDLLIKLLGIAPQTFPLIADLIGKYIDTPDMPQLVERLKTLVPQNVIAKENGDPTPPQQTDPMQMLAQQKIQVEFAKLQNEQKEQELKLMEIDQNRQKMFMDSKSEQLGMLGTAAKTHAEIRKAELETQKVHAKAVSDILGSHQFQQ